MKPLDVTVQPAVTATASRTPRVLMVTGAYHPEISSSAVQCRDMARLLAGRAETRVLTTAIDHRIPRRDVVDGVRVSRVFVDVTSRASKAVASLRMIAALLRLVPWCDVVHIHGFSTKNVIVTAAATLFRRPVVISLHTAGFDEADAIRQHSPMAWWAFTRADLYLSVSAGLVDAYLAAGLPQDRIQLVPNGIDIDRFRPADEHERRALRTRLGLPPDRYVVLFVGFFSPDKQPRVLFDAWLQLRENSDVECDLVFVGATKSTYFEVDDDLADRMRHEAAKRGVGDRMHFAGPVHDVEGYFRAADVYALPSRREGLPVALLEAMACGLPCVASCLPGSTDTIIEDSKNGLLVPPGDANALAAAIVRLVRDTALRQSLGAAARDTVVRRFGNADIAEQWLTAYHSLGSGSSRLLKKSTI
jgi:glycosyltransferase involved in cell wall biosynthesis